MRIVVWLLALVLLAATPAYATTAEPPQAPPSDRIGSHHDAASTSANAQPGATILASGWDKSSLTASGSCAPDGVLVVTVTNTGQNMTAATGWQFVVAGAIISAGALQLGAGDTATLQSPPAPDKLIEFSINQATEHPGTGIVKVNMGCTATAVALSGLSAAGTDDGQVARNVVLLVLVVCALLLVRWAFQKGK